MAIILGCVDLESKHKYNKSFCKIINTIGTCEHKAISRIKSEVSMVRTPQNWHDMVYAIIKKCYFVQEKAGKLKLYTNT